MSLKPRSSLSTTSLRNSPHKAEQHGVHVTDAEVPRAEELEEHDVDTFVSGEGCGVVEAWRGREEEKAVVVSMEREGGSGGSSQRRGSVNGGRLERRERERGGRRKKGEGLLSENHRLHISENRGWEEPKGETK